MEFYHRDDAQHGTPPLDAGGGFPLEVRPAVGGELSGKSLKLLPVRRQVPYAPPMIRLPRQIV